MKNLQITDNFGYSDDNYCYQENIKHLRKDTYVYVDWGNIAEPESLEDLFEILPQNNKKRKLIQFLRDGYYNPNYGDFKYFEYAVAHIFNEYSLETMKDFINDRVKVVYSYLNLPCPFDLESDGVISDWFYENLSKFKYSDFFASTQVQYVKNWDKSKLTFKGEINADI